MTRIFILIRKKLPIRPGFIRMGGDVFSASKQFLYHYYNKDGDSVRPLHWTDLGKAHKKHINFLFDRGLKRFNHLTGHAVHKDPKVIIEIEKFGFGTQRTLAQYEAYTGIDFKNKVASNKALQAGFIKDLDKYRDRPIIIPETHKVNSLSTTAHTSGETEVSKESGQIYNKTLRWHFKLRMAVTPIP